MEDSDREIEKFYHSLLYTLDKNEVRFMVGGGVAVAYNAPDIGRPMNDLDLFVKAGDFPKILNILSKNGYATKVINEHWLAKVFKGKYHVDLIFSSPNYMNPVDESWFEHHRNNNLFGLKVKLIAPEELIWCKIYIQDRRHFDGPDVNHLLLHQGKRLDWKRLLSRMESHWELLLAALVTFRFVYPSERGVVPKWVMGELTSRLQNQLNNPLPKERICRGPFLSGLDYQEDLSKGGFKLITG